MPLVVWPASLPQEPTIGYSYAQEPNVIRTDVGSGPAKTRRRSTRSRVFQSTQIEITGTQLDTFKTFWENINEGADAFTWIDFSTGSAASCRFTANPQYSNSKPGATNATRRYVLQLDLEVI